MPARKMLPLALLLITACDRGNEAERNAAADSAQNAESPATAVELIAPVRAVSLVETEFADMAAGRAARVSVRQYAQTLAADHRALIQALDSVARARGTTMTEPAAAQELSGAIRTAHAGLDNLAGEDFDLTYIRAEVESHRQLLEKVDRQLVPAATSADMRALLHDVRGMVDAHLTRARQLLAELLEAPEPPPVRTAPRPVSPPVLPPPDTTRRPPPDTTRRPPPDTVPAISR